MLKKNTSNIFSYIIIFTEIFSYIFHIIDTRALYLFHLSYSIGSLFVMIITYRYTKDTKLPDRSILFLFFMYNIVLLVTYYALDAYSGGLYFISLIHVYTIFMLEKD